MLARQVRRVVGPTPGPPSEAQWEVFLDRVSRAYSDADQDRYLMERSMELSTKEMLYSELRAWGERLDAVIQSLDAGLIVLDETYAIERANVEAARILGVSVEELRSWRMADLASRFDATVSDALLALSESPNSDPAPTRLDEAVATPSASSSVPVSVSVSIIPMKREKRVEGTTIVIRDISDQVRLESDLRQAQKLQAVGQLAAGVAHEINTPMQFITDNLRFLSGTFDTLLELVTEYRRVLSGNEGDLPWTGRKTLLAEAEATADVNFLEDEVPDALRQSLDGAERVTTIVAAMKAFAHPGSGGFQAADLNAALASTLIVARSEIRFVADVETDFGDLPLLPCKIGELNQVFLNLIVNAAHAIADVNEGDDRGRIGVVTRTEDDVVIVEISDNGGGIPPEHASRVFDPFFTTKPVGQGTGQGLALAHNVIVNGHGGWITFESTPGGGTTFIIKLPLTRLAQPK